MKYEHLVTGPSARGIGSNANPTYPLIIIISYSEVIIIRYVTLEANIYM